MRVLETKRLNLRRLADEDAEFIVRLLNEPSFLRFIGDRGVRNADDARGYIGRAIESYEKNGFGLYLVELQDGAIPIGICGLIKRDSLPDADIGFAFLPEFWGKGCALEAAAAIVVHARTMLGLKRILAITDLDNESSIKLLAKIGFVFERITSLTADDSEIKLFSKDLSQ